MDATNRALSLMGACAFVLTFVPAPLRSRIDSSIRDLWEKLFSSADPFAYVEVPRKSKDVINAISLDDTPSTSKWLIDPTSNPLYADVALYLSSLDLEYSARRVCAYGVDGDRSLSDPSKFVFGLPLDETLTDTFEGSQFSWSHKLSSTVSRSSSHHQTDEDPNSMFCLKMLKSDKPRLLHSYLSHVSTVAREIRQHNNLRTLYLNSRHGSHWTPVAFNHPSTFGTIALDGDLADRIQADLKAFSDSEAYYHSIGRAWKRGYLLYGPPGTGKSSLIAAIANYMHYDIYDLELTSVSNNSSLQSLLMRTRPRSIIVIEDIDCSMSTRFSDRQQAEEHQLAVFEDAPQSSSCGFTLSGLLNFTDGLLSCFGEERIFIFTTNHKERLDSALLRCGRMDMHIHLSYCTFSVMKKLARNYLGIMAHDLYGELEELLKAGVEITPASAAETFLSMKKDPDEAIRQILTRVKAVNASVSVDEVPPDVRTGKGDLLPKKVRKRKRELPVDASEKQHPDDSYAVSGATAPRHSKLSTSRNGPKKLAIS